MKIVFNDKFYASEYIKDCASESGRMESIINTLKRESKYEFVINEAADFDDILRVHENEHIEGVKTKKSLYEMALLAAGGAIKASNIAMNAEAACACIRPPGHHVYKASGWGYCYFCNMAIALKKLKSEGRISSAFILDFDAHTGDGTISKPIEQNKLLELISKYLVYKDNVLYLVQNYRSKQL